MIKTQLSQTNMTTIQPWQDSSSPFAFVRPTTSDENMNPVPPVDFQEVTLISVLESPSSFYPRDKKNSLSQTTLALLHLFYLVFIEMWKWRLIQAQGSSHCCLYGAANQGSCQTWAIKEVSSIVFQKITYFISITLIKINIPLIDRSQLFF